MAASLKDSQPADDSDTKDTPPPAQAPVSQEPEPATSGAELDTVSHQPAVLASLYELVALSGRTWQQWAL